MNNPIIVKLITAFFKFFANMHKSPITTLFGSLFLCAYLYEYIVGEVEMKLLDGDHLLLLFGVLLIGLPDKADMEEEDDD